MAKKRKSVREKYLEHELNLAQRIIFQRGEDLRTLQLRLNATQEKYVATADMLNQREEMMNKLFQEARTEARVLKDTVDFLLARYNVKDPRMKSWKIGDQEVSVKMSYVNGKDSEKQ